LDPLIKRNRVSSHKTRRGGPVAKRFNVVPSTRIRFAPLCPSVHKQPPTRKRIRPPVCLFRLVPDHVRKRMLRELTGKMRLVPCPIAEGAPEAVNGDVDRPGDAGRDG
jgi:hypothetical protein